MSHLQPISVGLPAHALVGMVHVGALPGTPGALASVDALVAQAADEARVLIEAGFDGILVENMHDAPYVHGRQDPAVTAAMTRAVMAVVAVAGDLPVGVQVLSGGNREAVAIAHATGARFVRCENFVFSHVADEGLLGRAEAGRLLRYRRAIGARGVAVWADVKKKHASHAITGDTDIAEHAAAAAFFGADAVIVTGSATGRPTDVADVAAAVGAVELPVVVGSGVTADNAAGLLEHASVLIVGSSIKAEGRWEHPVDPQRAGALVRAVRPTAAAR